MNDVASRNIAASVNVAGRLLIASDGLLKYVARDTIWRLGSGDHIEHAADSLVAAARLPGGGLQDDLSLVLTLDRAS